MGKKYLFQIQHLSGLWKTGNLPDDAESASRSCKKNDFVFRTFFPLIVILLATVCANGQATVTGTVKDNGGAAVTGVSVTLKGQQTTAATGPDGKYSIQVPNSKAVLIFSSMGFVSQEISVNGRTTIDIVLEREVKSLDNIVVIGYGKQKRVNLTGAVSSVDMRQRENRPITNASQALQGVSGLWVNQTGGKPGQDEAAIKIRGVGTTNNSNPLVLVDGVEFDMNEINPATIESISVLKDASAAIYGSRAANGVILVTTKAGKAGKTQVNYGFSHGIQNVTYLPDAVWDPIQYMELKNQASLNEGRAILFSAAQINEYKAGMTTNPIAYPAIDWLEEVTKKGYLQQHNLRFSGGSEKMVYSLSLGFMDQDGIFVAANHANRYSIDLNVSANITSRIKIGGTIKYNHRKFNEPSGGTSYFTNRWMRSLPVFGAYLEDGRYASHTLLNTGQNISANPYMMLKEGTYTTTVKAIFTKIYADIKLPFDLNYNFNIGVNNAIASRNQFFPHMISYHALTNAPNIVNNNPYAFRNLIDNLNFSAFHTLGWETTSDNKSRFSAMVGSSYSRFDSSMFSSQIHGFLDNSLTDISAGSINPQVSGRTVEDILQSYFSRVEYSFREKYLLDATLRYDGSSRFKQGKKWGLFYGLSGGWRIDKEAFFSGANLNFINLLKLRASYGKLGNQAVALYSYLNSVNLGNDYSFNNSISTGAAVTKYNEPEITWETTHTYDAGLDIAVWSNRINLSVDVFRKRTSNILRPVSLPSQVGGLAGPTRNVGTVDNTGVDISLSHRNRYGDFDIELAAEYGFVKNKVVDFNGEKIIGTRRISAEGYPLDAYYLYEAEGIYQDQREIDNSAKISNAVRPGYIRYKDQNNDGRINGDDRIITGSSIPTSNYSFTINVGYKRFSLNTFFQGVSGIHLYPTLNLAYPFNNGAGVTKEWVTDSWTPSNPGARLPILTTTLATENFQPSTFWLEDASYLRLKNIQLKYEMPARLISKAALTGLTFFVSGENLLTFSQFEKFDPEKNVTLDTFYEYPSVKTVSFGLNATF
ncbi:SusC/RagA family TonB-linked outer membrane protein [Longitalea luteola]|uniref:SusC/RagA family TonB-linked outer membrane protein n=1 Tax=Longitalea luteola TaxID=2812563 RepID=UPI001A97CFC8|nr:TonB-dependent receptor [Longitalea luteola]